MPSIVMCRPEGPTTNPITRKPTTTGRPTRQIEAARKQNDRHANSKTTEERYIPEQVEKLFEHGLR